MAKTRRASSASKRGKATDDKYISSFGMCETHGKRFFYTRAAAKKFMRVRFPQEQMNVYRCGNWWHIGHLLPAAKQGKASRDGRTWLTQDKEATS
jgi:hypothetical protein